MHENHDEKSTAAAPESEVAAAPSPPTTDATASASTTASKFAFRMWPASRSKNGARRWAFNLQMDGEDTCGGHMTIVRVHSTSLQMRQSEELRAAVRAARAKIAAGGSRFEPRFSLHVSCHDYSSGVFPHVYVNNKVLFD